MTLVHVDELTVQFGAARSALRGIATPPVQAVNGVSLEIRRGETLGLVGESGCGKSTLGRTIVGLHTPVSGRVAFAGEPITGLTERLLRPYRRKMQIVFQDPLSSLNTRMTVGAMLRELLKVHRIATGAAADEKTARMMDVVGLPPDSLRRYPPEFSGGQRQRVCIARALIIEPEFVVLDEAVSALDVSVQAQIINLLLDLQEIFHLTYLFISHDLSVVARISDRVAVMYLGEIVEVGGVPALYENPRHPYTRALLRAVPDPDRPATARSRMAVTGDLPSPRNPPSGCRFHTRCWLRRQLGDPEICTTTPPVLRAAAANSFVACHFAEEQVAPALGA